MLESLKSVGSSVNSTLKTSPLGDSKTVSSIMVTLTHWNRVSGVKLISVNSPMKSSSSNQEVLMRYLYAHRVSSKGRGLYRRSSPPPPQTTALPPPKIWMKVNDTNVKRTSQSIIMFAASSYSSTTWSHSSYVYPTPICAHKSITRSPSSSIYPSPPGHSLAILPAGHYDITLS